MTPEQENELVAKWMGYKLISTREGTAHWIPPHAPHDPWIATYPIRPPRYRTDPALLWELMERLSSTDAGWKDIYALLTGGMDMFRLRTVAEAVFAAAVVQAQEGK